MLAAIVAASFVLLMWLLISRVILSSEGEARRFVADLPRERIEIWDSLAECETETDWSAATGNGYYGGLQIAQQSWLEVGGEGLPNEATRDEQIMRAEAIYDELGWSAWPSCSVQLGLGN
jgi:Transglycosylase-like domain